MAYPEWLFPVFTFLSSLEIRQIAVGAVPSTVLMKMSLPELPEFSFLVLIIVLTPMPHSCLLQGGVSQPRHYWNVLGPVFFVVGCPVQRRFTSIPGLYLLDDNSTLPKLWQLTLSPDIAKHLLGSKISPNWTISSYEPCHIHTCIPQVWHTENTQSNEGINEWTQQFVAVHEWGTHQQEIQGMEEGWSTWRSHWGLVGKVGEHRWHPAFQFSPRMIVVCV